METTPNKFPKQEHLKSEKQIDRLFTNGNAFIVYPLRVVYLFENGTEINEDGNGLPAVQVLVSVPKKKFKRAVHRNRIKRLMRETYRLNKLQLYAKASEAHIHISVAFQYVADTEAAYSLIERKIKAALDKIGTELISDNKK